MSYYLQFQFPDTLPSVNELLQEVTDADGVVPFSEPFLRGLYDASFNHVYVIAREDNDDNKVIGILAFSDETIEMAVSPAHRRKGIGTALLEAVDYDTKCKGKELLPVWAHGTRPGAEKIALASGRDMIRALVQMVARKEAVERAAGSVEKRDDVEIVDYAEAVNRWGEKAVDEAWLRVNNEAFDWHPEQGGWDLEDLRKGRDTEWFDPHGVFFAVDRGADDAPGSAEGASAEDIVGFHWTKWHSNSAVQTGEVYVIGLAKAGQGRGLGKTLTNVGMRYLHERGAQRVILYVEMDNFAATALYRKSGFERSRVDLMYGAIANET